MKKLNIIISKPCHEQWEAMVPADHGKYCGACQKTVTDFSSMSDRQLAEFFKKPKAGTCGRFHHDQLARDIVMPSKRIPWIRYFFQFTWPAMILMLKSCGMKQHTLGNPSVEMTQHPINKNMQDMLIGDTVAQVLPQGDITTLTMDGMISTTTACEEIQPTKGAFMVGMMLSEVRYDPKHERPNSIPFSGKVIAPGIQRYANDEKPVVKERNQLPLLPDEVLLPENKTALPIDRKTIAEKRIVETLQITRQNLITKNKDTYTFKASNEILNGCTVFPNPVHAGTVLTVRFPERQEKAGQWQFFNASGQVVATPVQAVMVGGFCIQVSIPDQLAAGMYFIRSMHQESTKSAIKIMIL